MRYPERVSGLAVVAIVAGGCASSGPVAGIVLFGTGGDSAVDQRHYVGVSPSRARAKVIEALRGLAFQTESVTQCGSGRDAGFVIEGRRGEAERVKVTLKPAGGSDMLVTIQVMPPDPPLAQEIHEELQKRLSG
jgi:hypothetical protein